MMRRAENLRKSPMAAADEWQPPPASPCLNECLFRILFGFAGNVALDAMLMSRSNEEDIMKKLGYVIAALGAIAIAAPSIASAEMHRDHGWHRHHHDRVVIVRHRHHDY